MKLNERSLASYATSAAPADAQGFLLQRGRHAAYQRRWFVLRGNVLFYFEDAASREPLGVIVLEGCTVELAEAAVDFAFAVRCPGGRARAHQLAAESQAGLERWVKALSRASVQYLRLLLRELERQLAAAQAHAPLPAPRRPRPPPARPRDNGRAAWDAAPPGDPQAPPRPPPRRRAPEPLAPPHGAPFAQLHEWYGREVGALRACWQESRARP